LHRFLVPFAHQNAVAAGEICMGSVAHHAGRLATQLDLHDEAHAHFQAALEMNSRMGAHPWLAHTQTDYATMLLRRAARGDKRRALELLGEAVRTYEELGMPRAATHAHELAVAKPGRGRDPQMTIAGPPPARRRRRHT
jgi:tetratricopeptide (TPR) repeat protein